MNYKVTYVHREEEDAEANDIVKQRVMPTDSAKLTEAVIIDLTEYKVRLVEKKYEMLNGIRSTIFLTDSYNAMQIWHQRRNFRF